MINIDYQFALDWEHCNNINESVKRLSDITNLLNKVIKVARDAKKELLLAMAETPTIEIKLSFDNKLIHLMTIDPSKKELCKDYFDSKTIETQLKNKQEAILEELLALKKIADITPK